MVKKKVIISDITPAQVRAARALLDWPRRKLAQASGVTVRTLDRFEGGDVLTRQRTIEAVVVALEVAGVDFIPEYGGGGVGVRLRKPSEQP